MPYRRKVVRRRLQPGAMVERAVGGNGRLRAGTRSAAIIAGRAGIQYAINRGGDAIASGVRRVFKYTKKLKRTGNRKKVISDAGGSGGYNQWQTYKFKQGRSIPKRVENALVLRQAVRPLTYYFKGLDSDFSGERGYYWLSNAVDNTTTPTLRAHPLYMLNLTSVINDGQTPAVFSRLFNDVVSTPVVGAAQFHFSYQNGENSTGSATIALNVRDAPSTSVTTAQVGAKSLLKWVRMRFNLYGAKNRPTEFVLQLVRLLDEDLQPENLLAGTSRLSGADIQQNNFWGSLVKPLISNPIANSSMPTRKGIRIIATKKVNIDPTSSTENDANPHCKTIDWFWKANQMLNYVGERAKGFTDASLTDAQNTIVHANSDAYGTRPAKVGNNIYLMVYAKTYNGTPIQIAGESNTICPSFDMNVEMSHRIVDSF